MASSSGSDQSFERIYCSEDDFIADCIVSDALCGAYTDLHDDMGPRQSKVPKKASKQKSSTVQSVGYYDIIGPSSVPVMEITPETGFDENFHRSGNSIDNNNYRGSHCLQSTSGGFNTDHQCLRPSVSEQILSSESKELADTVPSKFPSSTSVFDKNDVYRVDRSDYCLVDQQTDDIYQLKHRFSDNKLPSPPENVKKGEKNIAAGENLYTTGEEKYSVASSTSGFSNVYTSPNYAEEFSRKQSLMGLLEYEISECFESLNLEGSDVSDMSVQSDLSVDSEPLPAPVNSPNNGCCDIDMDPNDIFKSMQQNEQTGDSVTPTLRYIKSKIKNVFEEARSIILLGDLLTKRADVIETWATLMERRANDTEAEREILEKHLFEREADWDRVRQEFTLEIDQLARAVQHIWIAVSTNDPHTRKRTISAANTLSGDSWAVDQKKGARNKKLTEESLAELLLHRHWKDHRGLIHEINRMSQITQLKLLIFSQQSYIRDLEQQHRGLNEFLTEISKSGCSIEDLVVQTKKRFPLLFSDSQFESSHIHHVLQCDRVNYFPDKSTDLNLSFLKAFQIGDYNKNIVSDDQASFELNDIPYTKHQITQQQCQAATIHA